MEGEDTSTGSEETKQGADMPPLPSSSESDDDSSTEALEECPGATTPTLQASPDVDGGDTSSLVEEEPPPGQSDVNTSLNDDNMEDSSCGVIPSSTDATLSSSEVLTPLQNDLTRNSHLDMESESTMNTVDQESTSSPGEASIPPSISSQADDVSNISLTSSNISMESDDCAVTVKDHDVTVFPGVEAVFHDRLIDLDTLRQETGVVSVDDLQALDVTLEEWPMTLVSQLRLRDSIVNTLHGVVRELVECGQVLEQDLDYLKLKVLELQQETKRRAKAEQRRAKDEQSHKSQGRETESQTTEEDFTEAWNRWYYGRWGDYYSESDPTSSLYWPGHYTNQPTVAPSDCSDVTQGIVEREQSGVTSEVSEGINDDDSIKEDKEKDSNTDSDTKKPEKRKKLKAKRKKEKHKKSCKDRASVETDDKKTKDDKTTTKKEKKESRRRKRREDDRSDDSGMTDLPGSVLPLEEVTSTASPSEATVEVGVNKVGEGKQHGWDATQSIVAQVASAAAQVVVESGYVFQEESGLYYDYNTGYYYNAVTTSDKDRATSDKDRATSDKDRATSDKDRATSDKDRATSDKDRATSDKDRATSDKDRATSDKDRATSDKDRASSDKDRATSDKDRATSDKDRATSDKDRAMSDKDRATSDKDRATSDTDRATSDIDRATSDKDRATSDIDRATSDKDSATSDKDRATSDKDSATSDIDRATSDKDRATSDKDRATATSLENGLYYDTKSGTYFYYDHASQSYQFHSQVTTTATTNNNTKKKSRKRKTTIKENSQSSSKSEDTEDKEDGECSGSEGEEEEEEGESEEEGEGEAVEAAHHHQEEALPNASPPSLLFTCPNHLHLLTLTWHFHSNSSPQCLTTFSPLHVPKTPPSPYSHLTLPLQQLSPMPHHLLSSLRAQTTSIALLSPGTLHSNSSPQCLTTFSPLHVPKPPPSPYSHLALPLQQLSPMPHHLLSSSRAPNHLHLLTLTWHFTPTALPNASPPSSPLHVPKPPPSPYSHLALPLQQLSPMPHHLLSSSRAQTTSISLLSPALPLQQLSPMPHHLLSSSRAQTPPSPYSHLASSTPTALPNASPPSHPLHVPKPPPSPYSHLALPLQQLSPMPHHLLSSSRAQTTSIALLSPGTSTPTALPNASPPSLLFTCPNHLHLLLLPDTSTLTAFPNASPPSLLFTCPNHLHLLTLTWHFHSNSSPQCLTTFSPLHVPKPPPSPYSHLALPLQQLSPMPHTFSPLHVPKPPPSPYSHLALPLQQLSPCLTTSLHVPKPPPSPYLSPGTSPPTALPNASPPSLLFTCPNHLHLLTLTWHFHSNSSPQCLTTFSSRAKTTLLLLTLYSAPSICLTYSIYSVELTQAPSADALSLGDIPPSLRLMVVEGGEERVRVGELHVVTLDGGTVGREESNAVHLPDLNVSKVHAEIEYRSAGADDYHYYVRDLGSNNGTFVRGVRLSEARQPSHQVELGHGWEVQFGSIKVKCHLHPGALTCNECEPGLVMKTLPSLKSGKDSKFFKNAKYKEKARRKELKALQKKYKPTQQESQAATAAVAVGYTDRTRRRQTQKGSDNPYEEDRNPLKETNKGFALLQKMGWSEGQGLGKANTGIKAPVQPLSVVGQAGLGSSQACAPVPPDKRTERRRKLQQITQERFKEAKTPHEF
ncbi:Angiogenic factor with G patch and FHA domains 1 [Chionoecetes opilio]|uniref:Angiogenic factor with G patch and FHA domains 1 n=1 Tax=Chionoecetes opilio TaxID=41210 RepID=A0A8J5D5X4_CHIOP|nr:Angiogenic factor with G patch and FHA domains 1 [Chionoecetes opilio]